MLKSSPGGLIRPLLPWLTLSPAVAIFPSKPYEVLGLMVAVVGALLLTASYNYISFLPSEKRSFERRTTFFWKFKPSDYTTATLQIIFNISFPENFSSWPTVNLSLYHYSYHKFLVISISTQIILSILWSPSSSAPYPLWSCLPAYLSHTSAPLSSQSDSPQLWSVSGESLPMFLNHSV